MPLAINNLNLMAGSVGIKAIGSGALGNGAPKLFMYCTEDTGATIDTAGYFNAGVAFGGAYSLLDPGDVIMTVRFASGAVPTGTGVLMLHVVNQKSAAGVIDVTNVIDIGGTIADGD
jgi:hypothetical protein